MKKIKSTIKRRDTLFIYGFLAWPIIHFLVFWLGMNVSTIYDSFFRFDIYSSRIWVGLENYGKVFDFVFGVNENGILNHYGLLNSLSLIPLSILINVPIMILFAYSIYKKIRMYNFFRIVLFIPSVISVVVLCLAFKEFVDGNGSNSIFYIILRSLGLGGDGSYYDTGIIPVGGFLGNEKTVWGTILVFSVWTGISGHLIYFTSAMSRLPDSVFESAQLDGATEMQQFYKICLPLIFPTVTTLSLTLISAVFTWMMPSLLLTDGAFRTSTIGLMMTQTIKVDPQNTVICAFGVLISIFGAILIFGCRFIFEKFSQEVEY